MKPRRPSLRIPYLLLLAVSSQATETARDAEWIAREFITAPAEGSRAALDPVLRSRYLSQHNGVTHLCFRQSADGVPIHDGDILVNLAADGSIINCHGRFTMPTEAPSTTPWQMTPASVLARAAELIGQPERSAGDEIAGESRFAGGDLARQPIPVERVWFREISGALVAAWETRINTRAGKHLWHLVIGDVDGRELHRSDLVLRAASYRVTPLPLSDPDDGPLQLISDPADLLASPFGWHDTDGVAGAEFTDTRGNNLTAQEDSDGNDTGGSRPDGGASLSFDFPPDFGAGDLAYRNTAIVNAFYVANACHDIFHHYGFTASAGNFQENNYGNGGLGGDAIQLDTEDAAATGNAFFFPSADGDLSFMEFGIEPATSILTVDTPASLAGVVPSEGAEFGPRTSLAGIDAGIVAAIDAADATGPSTTDCCSPPTNAAELAGNIALIDRGSCNFDDKVLNAQNAGAIAVIMVNNDGDDLVVMGGDGPGVTIPSVFVGQSDGEMIRAALAGGVSANLLHPSGGISLALDSGIVIHEYAHGLTIRLTGGPANDTCLDSLVGGGLGEGWSDFYSLALTTGTSEVGSTPRAIGRYISPPDGFRGLPYSTDRSVNPFTYGDITALSEVHDIGEVWCTMLWDLHWELVRHHGFSTDPGAASASGGNHLTLQLVTDALKLQPCEPSFTDARDAILTADQVLTGGTNAFGIWNAFARRGLGENATEGINGSDTSVDESFAVPSLLDLADDDHDGLVNLMETALGGRYLSPDSENLPEVVMVPAGPDTFPALRYRRLAGGSGTTGLNYTVDGITYTPETGTAPDVLSSGSFVAVSVDPSSDPAFEIVTVRSTLPVEGHPKQFFRLRVTRTST